MTEFARIVPFRSRPMTSLALHKVTARTWLSSRLRWERFVVASRARAERQVT